MTKPSAICQHCGYQISTFTEALESLESGGKCLLCGGSIDSEKLAKVVDSFSDSELLSEGSERAEEEGDLAEEDEFIAGPQDFGDDGEDEEDPLL
ncbi:MAG: hypothetical protein COB96_00495 [Planctomycetota bacterium]|jgi:hypothetical protein|nr:MAG: hypothetical protein COB96_00495 [Planctomycetota bacterium]